MLVASRPLLLLVCAALVVSGAPTLTAQHQGHQTLDAVDNTVIIHDAKDDVSLLVAPRQNPAPQNASCPTAGACQGNFDHIDLVKLVVGDETETGFKFHLTLKSLTNSNPSGFPFRSIGFSYGRMNWQVTWGACQGGTQGFQPTKGCIRYGNQFFGGGLRGYKEFTTEVKAGDNTIVFPIEKLWVFNENRVPARFGTQLKNLTATGTHYYAGVFFVPGGDPTGGIAAIDRAPNSGPSEKAFQMIRGSNSHGHLAVDAPSPIRVSNGEATTIVYKVDLLNHNVEPMRVQLTTENLPADWLARAPALVKVPAQQKLTIPVILSMPFTHDHGKTVTFKLKAQSLDDDASYGDTDLGVFWTEIPQPSGHHETDDGGTFFHTGIVPNDRVLDQLEPYIPTYQMWMNGILEDPDPSTTEQAVPSGFNEYFGCLFTGGQIPPPVPNCRTPPEYVSSWFFPLNPPLLMGLDFDVSKKGLMTMAITPDLPASNAKVVVELRYCDPALNPGFGLCQLNQTTGGGGTCARSYPQIVASGSTGASLTQGTPSNFQIELTVDPKFDLVPYKAGVNLGLCIRLVTTDVPPNVFGANPSPDFDPKKARLRLPLVEYHDPVDQEFENVGALTLSSLTPFEKRVNPGRTAVFRFELASNSTSERRVDVDVQGIHSEWAELVTGRDITLEPATKRVLEVAVTVPDDAAAEERAELFVVAQDRNDAAVVTVTRFRATVVDKATQDIPSETAEGSSVESDGGIPALPLLGVVAAAAVALGLRRRRP